MKKITILTLVVLVLLLTLTACGKSSVEQTTTEKEEQYVPEISQPDEMPQVSTPSTQPTTQPPTTATCPPTTSAEPEIQDSSVSEVEGQVAEITEEPGQVEETEPETNVDGYENHDILTPYAKDKISEAGEKFVDGCNEFGHYMGDKLGEGINWAENKYQEYKDSKNNDGQ